ncbi:MAG: TIGR03915 family putative DNA repair protein, partial [Chryseobacterium sp.]|nr:TIGR03915 family putative DNA repair protein [Chryseobacterium sp.]
MIYIIDGSLEGLLCAVFEWFERKPGKILLQLEKRYQPDAFTETLSIYNEPAKADRVWKGLQQKLDKAWMRRYYCAFLSELPEAFTHLFEFTCYLFVNGAGAETNYGNEHVLAIAQLARKVEREKHRMEAFIRFKESADGLFYCGIDPDFNVTPLIMKHFKDRYADQKWIIYDMTRHYGIYYDLEKVEEVYCDIETQKNLNKPVSGQ